MSRVHGPVVAGRFYPADAAKLRAEVGRSLADAAPPEGPPPKAVIAPHAGYVYSGPVAGTAYAALAARRGAVERVVLLGPSHFAAFEGLALPSVDAFRTPLGDVPLDREAIRRAAELPDVRVLDEAFAEEHSLEVHLPFLQVALGTFRLVPCAVGDAKPPAVAAFLDRLWGGPETAIVVSSDLSHYLDHAFARETDLATARRIEALEPVGRRDACGSRPINGLLLAARARGLTARTADLRSSGDTAGDRRRVVGYGAFLFH